MSREITQTLLLTRDMVNYDRNRDSILQTQQRQAAPGWEPPVLSDFDCEGPGCEEEPILPPVDPFSPNDSWLWETPGPELPNLGSPLVSDPAEELPPPNAIDPNRNVSEEIKDMIGFLIGSSMAQKKEAAKQPTSPFDNETVAAMFIVGAVVLFAAFM
jgi:hypothetical protein